MDKYNTPGVSIALIDNGKVQIRCYGVKTIKKSGRITPNTLFQAASLSKPLTAFGILLLVQDGKLDLDEDVNQMLTPIILKGKKYGGLGLFIDDQRDIIFNHSGANEGFVSFLEGTISNLDHGIVIMMNGDNGGHIINEILKE